MSYDKDILIETYDDVLARVTAEKEDLIEKNESLRKVKKGLKELIDFYSADNKRLRAENTRLTTEKRLWRMRYYGGRYDE